MGVGESCERWGWGCGRGEMDVKFGVEILGWCVVETT